MPLIYWGTGWFIGIALASAFHVIQQILPEPQASLLNGILLGVDAGLPVVVQEDVRITGTSHIIAISGQI
jgi:predicted membrane metal-binding protein